MLATLALSLVGLTVFATTADAAKSGADVGGNSKTHKDPRTGVELKLDTPLVSLAATDYVIVSSPSTLVTKAQKFKSFKSYMDGKSSSVYLMTKADAQAFKGSSTDVQIETAKPIKVATTQTPTPSWGLDRIDSATALDSSYSYDSTGTGVKAYVVDTGISSSQADFGGRVGAGYSYIQDNYGTTDCHGHGTHVSGTIAGNTYGVAKATSLIPVRVLDCTGSGTNLGVIAGINWIVSSHTGGPAVINMSIGGGFDSALNNAIANATAAGFVVVVAAGNEAKDACLSSPSSAASAITVSAVDQVNKFASFSNFGSCVDIAAPGVSITSDYIGTSTATATMSGTSMAAPHVAGVVARMLQTNPTKTPAQISADLSANSAQNVITSLPAGTANKVLNLQVATAATSPATPSPVITKGASNLTVTVSVPTGSARPTGYKFETYKNGALWSSASAAVSSTTTSVKYTTPKIAKRSGTYVVKVTATNSAGSATFTSNGYVF